MELLVGAPEKHCTREATESHGGRLGCNQNENREGELTTDN